MAKIPDCINLLQEPNRSAADSAWRDYGEVVLVDSCESAVSQSDHYAPEHLEVHAEGLDW